MRKDCLMGIGDLGLIGQWRQAFLFSLYIVKKIETSFRLLGDPYIGNIEALLYI